MTLFAFDEKIARYLVIDELKIVDYTDFSHKTPMLLYCKRLPRRTIGKVTPLMNDSDVEGKKLEVPLDAYACREYHTREWRYIGSNLDVEPIDLPTIIPSLIDTPDQDELFFERECYIPADDPAARRWCLRGTGRDFEWRRPPPIDVRDLRNEGDDNGEDNDSQD
jgi:hypothetical protein